MRTAAVISIIIALVSSAAAQWYFFDRKLAVLEARSRAEIEYLAAEDYHVDKVEGMTVYLYVTPEEMTKLTGKGYDIKYIPDQAKIYADQLWESTKDGPNPMDDYHTYTEVGAFLDSLASAHPALCRLYSAGQSVQGRELWVMEISDNVTLEEEEPEFLYVSTMHGDEPVGTEMCLYLIEYLLNNYQTNPQIRYLVDETHIYFVPMMNPDGNNARSRYNATGHDLNREFPDRIDDPYNILEGRPQEVQVLMDFHSAISANLSANFHTGALVVNYPYDSNPNRQSVFTPTPDEDWFVNVSLAYSIHNLPMYNGSFPRGITNGAAWYIIFGGMQDWIYTWEGGADVTIELSNSGWPPANTLPGLWEDNRMSMLSYISKIHQGVRGLVTDDAGNPIPAIITIDNNPNEVYPDPDLGDYYRLLLPGNYALNYYCYGYQPVTVGNVSVNPNALTRVDVRLSAAPPGYVFDDLEGGVTGYSHSSVTPGYGDQWHLSESRSVTLTHSFKCGDSGTGNYSDRLDAALVTPVFDLQPGSILSFWHYMDAEISGRNYPYAYDGGFVEIRLAGDTAWTRITPQGGYPCRIRNTGGTGPFPPETPVFAGHIDGREAFFPLDTLSGQAQFRFRFGSDGSATREGWYLDDIELELEGGGIVSLHLNPVNPPVVIPSNGGNFDIAIEVRNNLNTARQFDCWAMVELPNGNIFGPIIQRRITLGPGVTVMRTITQNVPPNAPPGEYRYIGRAGIYPAIWVEDSFGFVKQ